MSQNPKHSESIVKAPHILFLGAGTSRPLGKMLMGEFVQNLMNNRPPNGQELFNAICRKEKDLEFLLEELGEIASKEYLAFAAKVESLPTVLGAPRTITTEKARWTDFQEMWVMANDLNRWLVKKVFRHYCSIDNPERTVNLFENPISNLTARSKPLVVFTTNYDPAVEKYVLHSDRGIQLVDGFRHDTPAGEYVWDRNIFDRFSQDSEEFTLILFKLHGSTNWIKKKNSGIIIRSESFYTEHEPDYDTMMIYPAKRKIALHEPFFTAYDYLQKCLSHAELCLVIGYSFRDYDSRMRFKSAKISNPNLRIVVLDPFAETLQKELGEDGIEIEPLPYYFGGTQKKDEYESEIENLIKHKVALSGKVGRQ